MTNLENMFLQYIAMNDCYAGCYHQHLFLWSIIFMLIIFHYNIERKKGQNPQ